MTGPSQERCFDSRPAASGLLLSSDVVGAVRHFAFGPQADITRGFPAGLVGQDDDRNSLARRGRRPRLFPATLHGPGMVCCRRLR
jgi:hypothetical protein